MSTKPDLDAIRDTYLDAFRRANQTENVPQLTYDRGWWKLRILEIFDACYRTRKLVGMTALLERRAACVGKARANG